MADYQTNDETDKIRRNFRPIRKGVKPRSKYIERDDSLPKLLPTVVPVGQYRGRVFAAVPDEYLRWLLARRLLTDDYLQAISNSLQKKLPGGLGNDATTTDQTRGPSRL